MNDVTAQASNGFSVIAIENEISNVQMTDVTAEASGSSDQAAAIAIRNRGGAPVINRVTATATGPANSAAVDNDGDAAVTIDGLVGLAEGTTPAVVPYATGVETSDDATVTIHGSSITAISAGAGQSWAISNNSSGLVTVDNSELIAGRTVLGSPGATTRIGSSLMSGGPVGGGPGTTCAGVHDETYTFFAGPACP